MEPEEHEMTVFYDGNCPLCNWEIDHLKKQDNENSILFENIQDEQFAAKHPELNKQQLDDLLHVQQANGQWQTGLDANYLMWRTVGKGKWFAPLKWSWLRPILQPCYLMFAKHRHKIASIMFSKKHTSDITKKDNRHE